MTVAVVSMLNRERGRTEEMFGGEGNAAQAERAARVGAHKASVVPAQCHARGTAVGTSE